MGRVLGRVEVDRDPAGLAAPPPLMPRDDTHRQLTPQRVELLDPDVVLEPRDRRLRGEGVTVDRIAPEQERVGRIVGEAVGIVGVGMAARDPEDPLAEHIRQGVSDLPGLPVVDQTVGESVDHAVLPFRCAKQDSPTIGTRMRLIERSDEGLVEEIREEHSLW